MDVTWPPNEKVKLFGALSRPQVIGVAAGFAVFGVGIMLGELLRSVVMAVPVLVWTMASHRGAPIRTTVTARCRWMCRRDKVWSSPIRGHGGVPACLRGIKLCQASVAGQQQSAGVVEGPGAIFTVVFAVDAPSLAFLPAAGQSQRFEGWGDVLGGLCVEPGTVLSAERIAWTDVHRAADPAGLVAHHRDHGVDGPASADYTDYVAEFGSLAASHQVLVSVTVTRAGRLRTARQHGFTGTPQQVMRAAAVSVGVQVGQELQRRGYQIGPLLSPCELGRLIVDIGDPFAARHYEPTAKERFGLAERSGPDQLTVERHQLAIDGAYHRVLTITWPRTRVDADWMWRPLGMDGPKVVTVVFEPIPPSTADSRREALTTRAESNNTIVGLKRGRVRTTDKRKTQALQAAERAVDAGHQELDGYALVVISGRTPDEVSRRCQQLRQTLREAGRAGVRELTGQHDFGFVAALPLGVRVKPAVE
jgi:hypothetical protein